MKHFTLLILLAATSVATAQKEPVVWDKDVLVPVSPFQPDLTPGYVLIEGDIQIPLDKYKALFKSDIKGGFLPSATYGPAIFWAGNTVPYDFVTTGVGTVSAANQTLAINAMNSIATRAGITFRPAVAGDANRIRFQNSSFNNSPVGVQSTQPQIINITSWSNYIIICHEVYHSLGFQHEQSRSDRGTFITVNTANICGSGSSTACTPGTGPGQCCLCPDNLGNCTDCTFNFNIVGASSTYGSYDFDSFMHYGPGSFSCNGGVTISVNPPFTNTIGQRNHFSYFDAITCRALYSFSGDRWWDRDYSGTSSGTFTQPYNNTTLAGAMAGVPSGGTLFIKYANTYSAVGTYSTPVTIVAPNGATLAR